MKKKKLGRPAVRPIVKPALMKAVNLVGGLKQLSLDTGITDKKISEWLHNPAVAIPAHHVHKIVTATQGKVKAEDLRPDVFVKMPP